MLSKLLLVTLLYTVFSYSDTGIEEEEEEQTGRHVINVRSVSNVDTGNAVDVAWKKRIEEQEKQSDWGEVKMNNYLDRVYTGNIKIGGQFFRVVFDTGSADVWVYDKNYNKNDCDTCSKPSGSGNTIKPCNGHLCCTKPCCADETWMYFFDENKVSEGKFKLLGTSWSITYGQGGASGVLGEADIRLGNKLVAKNQIFALAKKWNNLATCSEPMDGIMGLAYKSASRDDSSTVLETLKKQGAIHTRQFSFHLNKLSDGNHDSAQLIIGRPDEKYFKYMKWTNVLKAREYGMWWIAFGGMDMIISEQGKEDKEPLLKKQTLDKCSESSQCEGLMDTGTSYLTMPVHVYEIFTKYIMSKRLDCYQPPKHTGISRTSAMKCWFDDLKDLPTLHLYIAQLTFVLTPEDYTIRKPCGDECPPITIACAGHDIMGTQRFILADPFLRKYYTVFDQEKAEIGLGSMEKLAPAPTKPNNTSWVDDLKYVAFGVAGLFMFLCLSAFFCRKTSLRKQYQKTLAQRQRAADLRAASHNSSINSSSSQKSPSSSAHSHLLGSPNSTFQYEYSATSPQSSPSRSNKVANFNKKKKGNSSTRIHVKSDDYRSFE